MTQIEFTELVQLVHLALHTITLFLRAVERLVCLFFLCTTWSVLMRSRNKDMDLISMEKMLGEWN